MNARDLLPGERILASSSRHWVVLLKPFATTILAVLVVLVMINLPIVPLAAELRLFLSLGALLIALAVLNLYYWGWRAHEYVLTDQRVILNAGIVSRFSRSLSIDRIQDVTTYQTLFGRTWGFGDIELESAGREGAERLETVPRPQQMRNAIFAQMEARRRPLPN